MVSTPQLHMVERTLFSDTVTLSFKLPGIGHIGIHAFFEGELFVAAHVVALPVAGTVGAFAPVLLHIIAVDDDLVGGAFVEAGEIAAQHNKIGAHGQC